MGFEVRGGLEACPVATVVGGDGDVVAVAAGADLRRWKRSQRGKIRHRQMVRRAGDYRYMGSPNPHPV